MGARGLQTQVRELSYIHSRDVGGEHHGVFFAGGPPSSPNRSAVVMAMGDGEGQDARCPADRPD